jgi:hypothetical protein
MSSNKPRGEVKVNNNNNSLHNKILLVDDEPDITTVFALGLEDYGFKVDVFMILFKPCQISRMAHMILCSLIIKCQI